MDNDINLSLLYRLMVNMSGLMDGMCCIQGGRRDLRIAGTVLKCMERTEPGRAKTVPRNSLTSVRLAQVCYCPTVVVLLKAHTHMLILAYNLLILT